MKKIIYISLLFICSNTRATSIDSIFNYINTKVFLENDFIKKSSDSLLINDLDSIFCITNNDSKNLNYRLFFSEDKKMNEINIIYKNKIEYKYFLLEYKKYYILVNKNKTHFILINSDFNEFKYLLFNFEICEENKNFDFNWNNLTKIISLDHTFFPITQLFFEKNNILGFSNISIKSNSVFEDFYFFYSKSRCFNFENKDIKLLISYFNLKGELVCNVFKNMKIEIEKDESLFWFLNNYKQKF